MAQAQELAWGEKEPLERRERKENNGTHGPESQKSATGESRAYKPCTV